MKTGCSLPKTRYFSKYIMLSQLPPECYTESSICGNFLLEGCFLRGVVRNDRTIREG